MSRRAGHEDCPSCEVCGLTNCSDCDTEGKACRGWHQPVEGAI